MATVRIEWSDPRPRSARSVFFAIAALLWLAAVAFAFVAMCRQEFTPGRSGRAPSDWPTGSQFRPDPRRFTLVLALHPRCPCSRASIGELAQILAACPGQVEGLVLVYGPENGESWDTRAFVERLEKLPGIRWSTDAGGREARGFGALTSGHACLFGPGGGLLYSGGITGGRGKQGNNPGRQAIVERVRDGVAVPLTLEVYGCPLFEAPES